MTQINKYYSILLEKINGQLLSFVQAPKTKYHLPWFELNIPTEHFIAMRGVGHYLYSKSCYAVSEQKIGKYFFEKSLPQRGSRYIPIFRKRQGTSLKILVVGGKL